MNSKLCRSLLNCIDTQGDIMVYTGNKGKHNCCRLKVMHLWLSHSNLIHARLTSWFSTQYQQCFPPRFHLVIFYYIVQQQYFSLPVKKHKDEKCHHNFEYVCNILFLWHSHIQNRWLQLHFLLPKAHLYLDFLFEHVQTIHCYQNDDKKTEIING